MNGTKFRFFLNNLSTFPLVVIGIGCWNPAFDVTPAELITGIITEKGVFTPSELCDRVKEIIASTST